MVAGEEDLWTQIQHGVFEPPSHQTYEAVYGGGFDVLHVLFATCGAEAVGIAAAAVRRTEAGTPFGYSTGSACWRPIAASGLARR